MNKIERLHYSSVVNIYLDAFKVGGNARMDCEKAAIQAATISEQIAVEFADWIRKNCTEKYMSQHSWETIFQEFLKTKQ